MTLPSQQELDNTVRRLLQTHEQCKSGDCAYATAAEAISALRARIGELAKPGTFGALANWVHEYAEREFGRSGVQSNPPTDEIVAGVNKLRADLAAANARIVELEQSERDTRVAARTIQNSCESQIAAANARAEALQKDAERYRWLRANPGFFGWEHDFQAEFIDREVDAARVQEEGHHG